MSADICSILGIKYPIIQGAMTPVSEANLVSAVSNAGGMGIFAPGDDSGVGGGEWLREQIRKIRTMTDKPFGVNLPLRSPHAADFVKVMCEEKVKFTTTGGGKPDPYIPQLKEAGVIVAPVVPSVEIALKMEKAGVDMVVAEGMESGGFIGKISTMALIPAVTSALKIPVIAAGGFADGYGLAAAFAMGASGVQMGTRFMLSKECVISQVIKDAMISARSTDAVPVDSLLKKAPQIRALKTKAVEAMLQYEISENPSESVYKAMFDSARPKEFIIDGRIDDALLGMGQAVGSLKEEKTVAEIIEGIMEEYREAVKNIPRL